MDPHPQVDVRLTIGNSFVAGCLTGAALASFFWTRQCWVLTPLAASLIIMMIVWMENQK